MKIKIFIMIILAMLVIGVGTNKRDIAGLQNSFDISVLDACVIVTDGAGHGSGVAIAPDLILTAKHCIDFNDLYVVDSSGEEYAVIDSWCSDEYDIGFLRIDGVLPCLSLGNMPNLLDPVYAIGTPLEQCFVNNVTIGVVTKLNVDWAHWIGGIIVNVAAYPGNSGGALLNSNFEIVGITVGCHNRLYGGGDNLWLCESVTHIREALEEYGKK